MSGLGNSRAQADDAKAILLEILERINRDYRMTLSRDIKWYANDIKEYIESRFKEIIK